MFVPMLADSFPTGLIILFVLLGILLLVVLISFVSGIKIVRQTENYIVERLGKYHRTLSNGVHFVWPFFERVVKKVSLKEQIYDFKPQSVITKDNVTIQIDSIVFFQILDPKLFTYGVEDPIVGIEALTSTTMRNLIGDLDLDDTLTSRDFINSKMRSIIDEATDPWGIKVTRVEVKNILPPRDIQEAMEKQMRAEREKREKILIAEAEKTSAITIAEGKKESMILNAEGNKQAKIKAAEAEAEAILKVQQAKADAELKLRDAEAQAIERLNASQPSREVLALKALEAYTKVADGQATKIIVPSDLQDITSYLELLKDKSVPATHPVKKEDLTADVRRMTEKTLQQAKEDSVSERPSEESPKAGHEFQEHPLD